MIPADADGDAEPVARELATIVQVPTDRHVRSSLPEARVQDLYRKAGAIRWNVSASEFGALVEASVDRAFTGQTPTARELDRYLDALHVSDLGLAGACAQGRDAAWEHFILEHRAVLYRAADALDPSGGARDIADSLYAELYGVGRTGDARQSLFRYFHGRSSLATWLRAVLAQRYVDRIRAERRIEPLAVEDRVQSPEQARDSDPDRTALVPLVSSALLAAIDSLPARDRLRLRSYYVSQLTLAEIGRITGEHEATVSRHLSRTRKDLRIEVERYLRDQAGLTPLQVARALELALEDPGSLDLQQVFDPAPERKESAQDRSKVREL